MGGKLVHVKDRITEAAGMLADDDSLTSEGKLGQVVRKVKEKVERVNGKLEQAVDQMKGTLRGKRSSRSGKW